MSMSRLIHNRGGGFSPTDILLAARTLVQVGLVREVYGSARAEFTLTGKGHNCDERTLSRVGDAVLWNVKPEQRHIR